jgi:flagellar assembly protein FliH
MLAKVLPGGTKAAQAIQWPTAESYSSVLVASAAPQAPSGEQLYLAELNQARQDIGVLRAEVERAREEADRRAQEAFAAGGREGEAATRQALEPKVEAEVAKLRQMIRDALSVGPKLRHQAEEDLVRLAVAVARRILHREITVDADAMVGLVKAAFARLDQREVHQIRTDPDSVALVQKVLEGAAAPRSIKVTADQSLRRGSLIIETTRGQLDASIETQLQEIQRGFTDIVTHT